MESFLFRWLRRVRLQRERNRIEREMDEEMRHHVALEAEQLVREENLPLDEAHRRAMIVFGGMEAHKQDARVSRGFALFDRMWVSWLDVKLGMRMLTKYPGLSVVSVLGMTVAVAIGAAGFTFLQAMIDPTIPLPEGDRIVSLQNVAGTEYRNRQVLYDFGVWRTELKSVRDLAAFTSDGRNVVTATGRIDLAEVVAMTASGFRAARVLPLLGRTLLDEDERPGAPPVIVLGYDEWQRTFEGDPDIIGRTVRVGGDVYTVAGVMPDGYRFPVNHGYWVALQPDPTIAPGEGPSAHVFGRLTDGTTLEQAQAELTTIGARLAAAHPDTHRQLRPYVLPYAHPFFEIDSPAVARMARMFQMGLTLLLVIVAVNVAVLVYARTAARTGEIAVRSALGAGRARVVTQLFAEALVVSSIASALGLMLAGVGLAWAQSFLEGDSWLPFWFDLRLSPAVVLYAAALAVLAGVIVGVIPALKATGRELQTGLQQLSARGSRMQLGHMWTMMIVAQVVFAVAGLPFAGYIAAKSIQRATQDPGYPAQEIVSGWLSLEGDEAAQNADSAIRAAIESRVFNGAHELLRRLKSDPTISAVTFGGFPRTEGFGRVEVEGTGKEHWVRHGTVGMGYFDVFDVPIAAGRALEASDTLAGANRVVVNRVFAEQVLGGGNVLGRRIRTVTRRPGDPSGDTQTGPWLEVVGVVANFGTQADFDPADAKMYQASPLRYAFSTSITIRVREGASITAVAERFRGMTVAVDPRLRLHQLRTAADSEREVQESLLALAVAVVAVTSAVGLLSSAGVYAMMSFVVVQRRREIGIRLALGASPHRILRPIFARAAAQLGAGVVVGLILASAIARVIGVGPLSDSGPLLLPAVVALILVTGILAALGPAQRAIAVPPTDTLREE